VAKQPGVFHGLSHGNVAKHRSNAQQMLGAGGISQSKGIVYADISI
jgi:DNA-binding CsgD family transcriptional regulator